MISKNQKLHFCSRLQMQIPFDGRVSGPGSSNAATSRSFSAELLAM
jgi:hypothetical protein